MKRRPQKIRYRPHPWFDSRAVRKMFGIQARIGNGEWMHMSEDGKPLIYDTEAERDAKIKALRAQRQPPRYTVAVPTIVEDQP